MTRTEIIKNNIEALGTEYNIRVSTHKNYNIILISHKLCEAFTMRDVLDIINSSDELKNWKISLNYGDDGGEYPGYTYMDNLSRKNGITILDGDSEEYMEGVWTGESLNISYALNGKKDETIYIQNMDEGGEYSGARPMTFIEIYINKIGTSDRINFA